MNNGLPATKQAELIEHARGIRTSADEYAVWLAAEILAAYDASVTADQIEEACGNVPRGTVGTVYDTLKEADPSEG